MLKIYPAGRGNPLNMSEERGDNCRLLIHSMPEQRLSITKDSILPASKMEALWENAYCGQRVGGEGNRRFSE